MDTIEPWLPLGHGHPWAMATPESAGSARSELPRLEWQRVCTQSWEGIPGGESLSTILGAVVGTAGGVKSALVLLHQQSRTLGGALETLGAPEGLEGSGDAEYTSAAQECGNGGGGVRE